MLADVPSAQGGGPQVTEDTEVLLLVSVPLFFETGSHEHENTDDLQFFYLPIKINYFMLN